jgi:hypothetical protein
MTIGFLSFLICTTLAVPSIAEPQTPSSAKCANGDLSLKALEALSWPELDALYRAASPGRPPAGAYRGRAIYSRDQPFAKLKSSAAKVIWIGKDFDPEAGMLINRWRLGRAVRAKVYPGESFLDGGPTLVMDYRQTSPLIWRNVRDELREVGPGLYLGMMFKCEKDGARLGMFFALEECRR